MKKPARGSSPRPCASTYLLMDAPQRGDREGQGRGQQRRNAIMMDGLPDLPPSPSYGNDEPAGERALKRRQRTMRPHRDSTTPASASAPADGQSEQPLWTDGAHLVSSPEMISAVADAPAGTRQAVGFIAQQQQQQQQPTRRARAATDVSAGQSRARSPPGENVERYGAPRARLSRLLLTLRRSRFRATTCSGGRGTVSDVDDRVCAA